MGLTIDIDGGQIQNGEDKQLIVTPKDEDGTAITPSTLTADITKPSGTTVNKTKSDFNQDGNDWDLDVTFDEAGWWNIIVTATDSGGRTEIAPPINIEVA